MPAAFVYQIFYDASTRAAADSGFIPLDNAQNARPDWAELWVILSFLARTELRDDAYYGFFSPKFGLKTGLDSSFVYRTIERAAPAADALLFSSFTDDLALFQNPFEHGERVHPGLLDASQQSLDAIGLKVDLRAMVTCLANSVFSNFIVANATFWRQWHKVALDFFHFAENDPRVGKIGLLANVAHDRSLRYQTKVFIQERLATLVLTKSRLAAFVPEELAGFTRYDIGHRRLYVTLDLLKQKFLTTGNQEYLALFRTLREEHFADRIAPAGG